LKDIASSNGENIKSHIMDTTYVKYPQENFDHVYELCIYTHNIWIN
jgi:hypothetical protein